MVKQLIIALLFLVFYVMVKLTSFLRHFTVMISLTLISCHLSEDLSDKGNKIVNILFNVFYKKPANGNGTVPFLL